MIWRHLTSKEIGQLDKTIPVILPIGAIEIPASFRCCIANGIPIMVMKQAIAENT